MKNQQLDTFNYISYGSKVSADEVTRLILHSLSQLQHSEKIPSPICIWGEHGIGKTQLVQEIARQKDCQFLYIAPAQFEEMGDLVGMPRIVKNKAGDDISEFAPPEWVPTHPGPGILLIDDVNRADDRILRGIMQLLQNYELVSWKLPKDWIIVLTANPDGGDYSVTSMDDAMITRMVHVTMEFNLKNWSAWAEQNQIDPRGIEFVLAYPEVMEGTRTTPRTLVQFFDLIKDISSLENELSLIKLLGDGCLDMETTLAFINFVKMDLNKIIKPEEILNAGKFNLIKGRIDKIVNTKTKRLDVLSVMMTRLTNYLIYTKKSLTDKEFENLKQFILLELIPNDLRLFMAQELVSSDKAQLKKLYAVPEIGKLILTKM